MVKKSGILIVIAVALFFASCNNYNRLLKSTDFELKYSKAVEYYGKKNYVKALPLFEELMTVFRGTAKAEQVSYYYAYCNFGLEDYLLASYHLKNFVRTFPKSEFAEEAMFTSAYCYFLDSPVYSLDQENTVKAISEFQLFVNMYPNSEKIKDCNDYIDKLRGKLERKNYENAMLYFNIEDYKASMQAFKNLLKDFPDNPYREESNFMILKSNYLLAKNSIPEKKQERYTSTIENYYKFIDNFKESKYLSEAETIFDATQKQLKSLKQEKS
jgi:outer membrane protein assembly factor BamD